MHGTPPELRKLVPAYICILGTPPELRKLVPAYIYILGTPPELRKLVPACICIFHGWVVAVLPRPTSMIA